MSITRVWTINETTGRQEVLASGSYGSGGVSQEDVDISIAALVASAPGALNTLDELAAALGDDANYAATITTALAGKQPLDGDLTSLAALTTTAYGRALLELANEAALKALIGVNASTTADTATLTVDTDTYDQAAVTALAQALTIAAPTGTPVDGQRLVIRLKDNGTGRALTWNAAFVVVGVTLPTTTVATKKHYIGCRWNAATSVWDVLAVAAQA